MPLRLRAVLLALAAATACARFSPPTVVLNPQHETIDVNGLPAATLAVLSASGWTDEQWQSLLRVSVRSSNGDRQPPVAGRYRVSGATLRFTPLFPFDKGREYEVVLNPASLPAAAAPGGNPIVAVLSLPAVPRTPSTVVTHVYPSGDEVPANQLRLYLHFSAPMDWRGGADYVKLLDADGVEVVDAFLPLDADFWNDDRTRYTVFFDPGRVKRGILPNRQRGRALEPGRRYTLLVEREWRDGYGQPLKEAFRHSFVAAPAVERALTMEEWRVETPAAGSREPLVVTFPAPLDHGLLMRALTVAHKRAPVPGDVAIEQFETVWRFTPRDAWAAGEHALVALEFLEDVAGNRIGRPFEVDRFERSDASAAPARRTRPFRVAGP